MSTFLYTVHTRCMCHRIILRFPKPSCYRRLPSSPCCVFQHLSFSLRAAKWSAMHRRQSDRIRFTLICDARRSATTSCNCATVCSVSMRIQQWLVREFSVLAWRQKQYSVRAQSMASGFWLRRSTEIIRPVDDWAWWRIAVRCRPLMSELVLYIHLYSPKTHTHTHPHTPTHTQR